MSVNLRSSITEVGGIVTQIIHYVGGEKRTINSIITNSIKQDEFTKMKSKNGILYSINTKNVLMFETISEE